MNEDVAICGYGMDDIYVFGQAVMGLIWAVKIYGMAESDAIRILSALIANMLDKGWAGATECLRRFEHHDFVRDAFAINGYRRVRINSVR